MLVFGGRRDMRDDNGLTFFFLIKKKGRKRDEGETQRILFNSIKIFLFDYLLKKKVKIFLIYATSAFQIKVLPRL